MCTTLALFLFPMVSFTLTLGGSLKRSDQQCRVRNMLPSLWQKHWRAKAETRDFNPPSFLPMPTHLANKGIGGSFHTF